MKSEFSELNKAWMSLLADTKERQCILDKMKNLLDEFSLVQEQIRTAQSKTADQIQYAKTIDEVAFSTIQKYLFYTWDVNARN